MKEQRGADAKIKSEVPMVDVDAAEKRGDGRLLPGFRCGQLS